MITLDQLAEIFQHQTHLARKFHPHELMNGYTPPTWPVNINSRHGQDRLRQFAWWITEEICEAFTAKGPDHHSEELADTLHFAVELCLMCGYTPDDVWVHQELRSMDPTPDDVDFVQEALVHLGTGMNKLKKKPWKLDPPDTHADTLKYHLTYMLHNLLLAFHYYEYDAYDLYFKKKKINEQRIADGV